MDTSIKFDSKGNLIKPIGLTAEKKEKIQAIFREYSSPPHRYHFSADAIENFIVELNPKLFMACKILNSYDPDKSVLLNERKKLLCALEQAITAEERIFRLETEAITEHSRDLFRLILSDPVAQLILFRRILNDPAAPLKFFGLTFDGPVPPIKRPIDINGRIELMKYSPKYRDLYRRRDQIQEELDNSKRGSPPAPEICLDLIETIAEMFERHFGRKPAMSYSEGPFVQIVAFSLTAIGYPTSNPKHLFERLRKERPAKG